MIYFDKITLNSGQSLLIPHKPESLTLERVGDKMVLEKHSIQSFGLFDTAQPTFSTYYPEVKAEDLKPKEGEFARPVFRALSETIVHRKTNPIDFSKNGVLKPSMNKLRGQTVYANHEAAVGNEIGSVSKVAWQLAYETEDGLKVPAGINAEFLIDGKAHPNIVRAIAMDPPAIHSNSVTVSFGWEKSHPKMDDQEFRNSIGKFGSDGQLVRRIVSEIVAFHETSLVAHGADPFAQLIRDGQINNPQYVKAVEQLTAKTGASQVYYFSYKEDTVSLTNDEIITQKQTDKPDNSTMEKILALMATFFGVATLSEAEAETKLKEFTAKFKATGDIDKLQSDLQTAQSSLQTQTAEVTRLTAEVQTLTTEKSNAAPKVALADKYLLDKRNNAIRMYKVLYGDKDVAMLDTLTKADDTLLSTLSSQYEKQMDDKFPGVCNDCKGHNVSRNTAIIEAPPAPGTPGTPGGKLEKPLSDEEVRQNFSKSGFKANTMHGEVEKPESSK